MSKVRIVIIEKTACESAFGCNHECSDWIGHKDKLTEIANYVHKWEAHVFLNMAESENDIEHSRDHWNECGEILYNAAISNIDSEPCIVQLLLEHAANCCIRLSKFQPFANPDKRLLVTKDEVMHSLFHKIQDHPKTEAALRTKFDSLCNEVWKIIPASDSIKSSNIHPEMEDIAGFFR